MKPTDQHNTATKTAGDTAHSRLPCRGCMPDCKLYAICDGRPWKLNETTPS